MIPLQDWKPQVHPSGWPSDYITTYILHKWSSDFTNSRRWFSTIHVKPNQTLQSRWMDKDIFVLPPGWMVQFSRCWWNSACGGWLVENSRETSGAWILHWAGFLGKMLCTCLCLQSSWPLLLLLPLCSFPVSEEVLLLNAESPHQNKRQTVWGPALSEVAQRKGLFTCVSHLSSCHFTPTAHTRGAWAQKQDTGATSDQVVLMMAISLWREHRPQLVPHMWDLCQKDQVV